MNLIGQRAPAFRLKAWGDNDFMDIDLSSYRGKNWVVLFFYPLDFTFVCPTEIIAYDKLRDEFQKRSAVLLGCSVDSEFSHRQWTLTPKKDGGLEGVTTPLLADIGGRVAAAFGVLNDDNVAYRATFIIDPEGVVQHASVNNNNVGRNVEDTLRLLDAFQYVNSHDGEVCPANWQTGASVIKADVQESKNFFASQT